MKTVLITGGTRGIGRATVDKFLKENWQVAFLYKASDEIAEEITKNKNAFAVKCDVSSSIEVRSAVASVIARFGRIDALVNNAGISYSGVLQNMTDDEWTGVINTNLNSIFYTSREIIPVMLSNGGSIVNVSSMWGIVGASCEVAYSSAKAGVIGFTKALAKELAPSGIRVNAVAPGAIMTDMLGGYTKEELDAIAEETPLGRIGTPENIADAIYFLASDSAQFITGEVLNVNGGYVI